MKILFHLVKWRAPPFSKGFPLLRNSEKKNIGEIKKKKNSPEQLGQFYSNLAQIKHAWVKGIQVCSNGEPFKYHKVNDVFLLFLINVMIWPYVLIDLNCFLRWAMCPMGLLFIFTYKFKFEEKENINIFYRLLSSFIYSTRKLIEFYRKCAAWRRWWRIGSFGNSS